MERFKSGTPKDEVPFWRLKLRWALRSQFVTSNGVIMIQRREVSFRGPTFSARGICTSKLSLWQEVQVPRFRSG